MKTNIQKTHSRPKLIIEKLDKQNSFINFIPLGKEVSQQKVKPYHFTNFSDSTASTVTNNYGNQSGQTTDTNTYNIISTLQCLELPNFSSTQFFKSRLERQGSNLSGKQLARVNLGSSTKSNKNFESSLKTQNKQSMLIIPQRKLIKAASNRQLFAKNSILPEIQEKQSPEAGIRRIHQEISQNLHLKKESLLPRKSLIEINLCKDRISIENQNLLSQLVTIQLKQLNPELSSSIDGTSPASFKLRKIKIYRKKEPKKLTLEQVQINAIQDYPIILQISQSQQIVSNDFTPKSHQACDYNFSSKLIPISQFENQTIQEPNDFLTSHKVKPTHRIKMVDWMIQVLRVLQTPSVQTYFQAIYIMDKYFLEKQKQGVILTKIDLHEIGLVAMFISSKFEDVQHIDMQNILQDAGHNRFKHECILSREKDILQTLQFKIKDGNNIYEKSIMILKNILLNNQQIQLKIQDQDFLNNYTLFLCQLILHYYEQAKDLSIDLPNVIVLFVLKFLKNYYKRKIVHRDVKKIKLMHGHKNYQNLKNLQILISYHKSQNLDQPFVQYDMDFQHNFTNKFNTIKNLVLNYSKSSDLKNLGINFPKYVCKKALELLTENYTLNK